MYREIAKHAFMNGYAFDRASTVFVNVDASGFDMTTHLFEHVGDAVVNV